VEDQITSIQMADGNESDSGASEVMFYINNNEEGGDIGDQEDDRRRRTPRHHIKPDPYSGDDDWDQYISYFEDCA